MPGIPFVYYMHIPALSDQASSDRNEILINIEYQSRISIYRFKRSTKSPQER